MSALFFQCSSEKKSVMKDLRSYYQVESGKPVSVVLTAYTTTMIANGKDETLIRVAVADSAAREIRSAVNPVRIYIRGDATLITKPGSEELTYVSLNDTSGYWAAKLSAGVYTCLFRAGTTPDKIKLEVQSEGLWPASHEIHTLSSSFQTLKPTEGQLVSPVEDIDRILGADISFLPQMEERGSKFYINGKEQDVVQALADHGFNYIRLRIFVNPENEKGYAPGKGFCGLEQTKQMALRVKNAGMKLLLDFHYSDYWADPQQQYKPKAWENLSFDELRKTLSQYTKDVLLALKEQGTLPAMVQIGNEINHGMVWPEGYIANPDQLAELLKAGTEAVREVDPAIIIMMHLALGGQNDEATFWLDNMIGRGVTFDIIGLSYYPRWHGTLDDLQKNLFALKERYYKPLNIVEYSDYKKELNDIIFSLPDNMGKGTCIWEPLRGMFDRSGAATQNLFVYDTIAAKHYRNRK